MIKSKHTPGKWAFAGYDVYCSIPGMRRKPVIAVICNQDKAEHPSETEANGRLIAAAPELLEALQAFVSRAERLNGIDTGPLSMARAAIAKATVQS